jgi:hypothetical protein
MNVGHHHRAALRPRRDGPLPDAALLDASTAAPSGQASTTPTEASPSAPAAPATPHADLLAGDEPPAQTPDAAAAAGGGPGAEEAIKSLGLVAPEGAPFNDKTLGEIAVFATEHKLPKEAAQALVGRYAQVLTEAQAASEAQVQSTFAGWSKEIREHKDFGGSPEKVRQTSAWFAKAIDQVAPGYRQSLRNAGAMLEPALYLAFARFGQQMSAPSSAVKGGAAPAAEPEYASSFPATSSRYGGSKKES